VIDVVEIFQHWHAGQRIGELSSSLGLDPKTIRKYTARPSRPGSSAAQRRRVGGACGGGVPRERRAEQTPEHVGRDRAAPQAPRGVDGGR
jgi:hypothetical protein